MAEPTIGSLRRKGGLAMPAKSLPIWARMVQHYPYLRNVLFAEAFCKILCRKQVIVGTTREEREKIAEVAMGGVW